MKLSKPLFFFITALFYFCCHAQPGPLTRPDSIGIHKVQLDEHSKLVSWMGTPDIAYDRFLHQRWNFIKNKVPLSPGPLPRNLYPQYYFYCAFEKDMRPSNWMNDVGEKLPNWFESARLYYAYTGDQEVMPLIISMADYYLEHGMSDPGFAWPGFPYTTTNAGDTIFRGFTSAKIMEQHEIQVDHAGDMGVTYYRLFLFTGEKKYREAAIQIADVLAKKVTDGNEQHSPWAYRVVMSNGKITAPYGANWAGCYLLLHNLAAAKIGNTKAYQNACHKIQQFIAHYPMKTGFWTDGHSDTDVKSNTYKSNLSASNINLLLFDYPQFDAHWKIDAPALIRWTEDNFINRCAPGEPASQWGANIVGEQDTFLFKMDYQTARYAAVCARWYAVSADPAYKEKAFRSLNWVTYCNDSDGKAYESPLSKGILSWWSDTYGECPRMFYHVFAGIPEWAPKRENHILYSENILTRVRYSEKKVEYYATANTGTDFLKLAFKPLHITINGKQVVPQNGKLATAFELKELGGGDYSLIILRNQTGSIVISGE